MKRLFATLAALALAGCSERHESKVAQDLTTANMEAVSVAAPSTAMPEVAAPSPPSGVADLAPRPAEQIAYSYRLRYRVPSAKLGETLGAHRSACAALGPACTIIGESRFREDGGLPIASLSLRIDSGRAAAFADQADMLVANTNGEVDGRRIESENLTTQIIDIDARLRSKLILADRLEALLKTRQARVADLVEAERALAEARGDIDSARSQLAEMRRRVAQSDMTLNYEGIAPEGSAVRTPVRDALAAMGRTFGDSLATLITFVAALIPWLIVLVPAFIGVRWLWRRARFWRRKRLERP